MGLFDLMVAPEHRGQGFGRGLLEVRLKWGFEQGTRLAYLQQRASSGSATQVWFQRVVPVLVSSATLI
ncbi:MAG: GNAT family N-acetyltransferase [Rhodothermaceae bacterium]|nr:GNAT family N-acetyltransferase [Rhodothermaceae bacterium]